jgi:hypothetical protein
MDKNINLMRCCHVWQLDYRRVPNWKQLKSLVYLFKLMNTFSYTAGMHDLLNNIIVTTFGLQFIYFRDTPARVYCFWNYPFYSNEQNFQHIVIKCYLAYNTGQFYLSREVSSYSARLCPCFMLTYLDQLDAISLTIPT